MLNKSVFTPKQSQLIDLLMQNKLRRINILYGSVRSGKTWITLVLFALWVAAMPEDKSYLMCAKTLTSLKRNCLDVLVEIFGSSNFSYSLSQKTATLFGRRIYLEGANDTRAEGKIRGMTLQGAYVDEITLIEYNFFEMLLSRLSEPKAKLFGSTNPDIPEHWVKTEFIDRVDDLDILVEKFTIDDNTFLDKEYVAQLKKEYSGVFYNRFILGEFCNGEGLVFPYFEPDKDRWITATGGEDDAYSKITVGIDFGETGSLTTMCCCGFRGNFEAIDVLREGTQERTDALDTETIANKCADFLGECRAMFGRYDYVFYDAAAPALGNRVAAILRERGLPWRNVSPCVKTPLEGRPVTVDGLLCQNRLKITPQAQGLIRALSSLRWDEKTPNVPEDKNIGNINDYWDSFIYSWSPWQEYFDRR